MFVRTALTAIALLLLSGCATNAVTGRSQFMIVSEQSAIAQSAQAYSKMIGQLDNKGKVKNDPALEARIDDITGKLVAQAIRYRPETKSWAWSVKIIDEPETINAFCMAGGKMAIYTGLIDKLDATDDELAQVMGHEIGHAIANHSAEKMSMAMTAQLGVVIFAALGTTARDRHVRQDAGALAAAAIITLPNSRQAESEADRIGIELAARAGYHPDAAASLWRKMMAASGSRSRFDFLSTHPAPAKRIEELQARAPSMMQFFESADPKPKFDLASGALLAPSSDSQGFVASSSLQSADASPLMLHTPEFERFAKGDVTLTCEGTCALPFALKRSEWKSLYDQGQWRLLVQKVVSSSYVLDLTYFYLARAAESLGYAGPAQLYFQRSAEASAKESTRCKGKYQDWCSGFVLPTAAEEGLTRMSVSQTSAER